MNRTLFFGILALAGSAVSAQNTLTKEITLDKDYVPIERKATKTNALPATVERTAEKTPLDYSQWSVPTVVPSDIPTMLPYGYNTTKEWSKQRGYVDFGIGTQLNIVGNAGINILNTEKYKLGVWYQHLSSWMGKNKANIPYRDGVLPQYKQKFNDNKFGVNFRSEFYAGTLDVMARGHLDKYNLYAASEDMNHNMLEVGINANWKSRTAPNEFNYRVGLDYNFLKFLDMQYQRAKTKEQDFKINFSGEYQSGDYSHAGINAELEILNQNVDYRWESGKSSVPEQTISGSSDGMVTLNPYFLYSKTKLRALIGAVINLSWGTGPFFRIAPRVGLDYAITNGVGVYLKAEGGKRINTISKMHQISRYWCPNVNFYDTYSPLDGEIGVKAGPFNGFSAHALFGYGIFKDAIVPTACSAAKYFEYRINNMSGWKAGVGVNYKYRSLAEADLSFTYAPQKAESGYMLGLDRAKAVMNARITVNPIEKLSVSLGYEMRLKRALESPLSSEYFADVLVETAPLATTLKPLQNVHNLSLGARYTLLKSLTLWANAANILNKRWESYGDYMYGQGFNFMAGLEFRF